VMLEISVAKIELTGTKNVALESGEFTVGTQGLVTWENGFGWAQFCPLKTVFRQVQTVLSFSVSVQKCIAKRGSSTIETYPLGEQVTTRTS